MSEIDQWAEEHKKRAQVEMAMSALHNMWKSSGVGQRLLMGGPAYNYVIGVDFAKEKQQQDGSKSQVEVHNA